ncbi:MAG TPA: GNAT family N-acetyltransferase [Chitinophaga sp.]|uniref:GNAT family N-acetyltransferase n=1 Tax=Chitinophaga sp. TaxID=1869181 RepID=UPI002CD9A888|nr:GNAT family N-acetyltransferase [Chitinophaga sp.]HVI48639.1 GNAT family N-acetyltransferase [Chitinophaga sp.]
MLRAVRTNPAHPDFQLLISRLDKELQSINGDDHAFLSQFNQTTDIKHVVVVYVDDQPAGCGAFKHYSSAEAEVKRMYTDPTFRGQGVATMVLNELETWAAASGYSACILETSIKLTSAVALYKKNGYKQTPNYGQYVGVSFSVCMKKDLKDDDTIKAVIATLAAIAVLLFFMIPQVSAQVTTQVEVTGLVEHPLTYSIDHLQGLKTFTGHDLKIVGAKGDVRKTFHTYKGISLKSILDSAKIVMPQPKEKGKYYIIVKGSDSYTVLYSWNEIFNNPTGTHVYLIFEENGKPITDDGRFVMICSNDNITGPRHVKWVQRIEVARLP